MTYIFLCIFGSFSKVIFFFLKKPSGGCCSKGVHLYIYFLPIANKPPKFTDVPTLYAFKGQTWKHQVNARDPESRLVKYEFVGESHGMRLSSIGIITWIPTESKLYNFTINVKDPCGLNASKQFLLHVKECSCDGYNGAECAWMAKHQPNNGSYCVCPPGCKGERYESFVSRYKFFSRCKRFLYVKNLLNEYSSIQHLKVTSLILLSQNFKNICF